MSRPLLGAIWLAAFLVSIDYTALNVALPTLARDFGAGTSAVSWAALAYMLVMVALTPVAGQLIDRIGYRRALLAGLAVFAAASAASAAAPGLWPLVTMRAVQGIGAAIMFVIGPAMIKTSFAAAAHDRAFAIYSTGPTAGLCAGPAIGGQLTAMFGWRAVLLFNLPVVILALVLLRFAPRETGAAEARSSASMPSPASVVSAVAALSALLLALNQGEEWGWNSPGIIGLLLAAGSGVGAVMVLERRAAAPLIDPAMFASRNFSMSAAVFFLVLLVFGGEVFLLPFYFEWLRKSGTATVGHLLAIQPVATILVSNLAGFCLAGISRRSLCLAGIAIFAAGIALFAGADQKAPPAMPIAALALIGAGAGLYYPALIQISMAELPNRLAAAAASLQTAVRVLAQLLGVVVFETILSQLYPTALDVARAADAGGVGLVRMQSAFQAVFWIGAGLALLALLPALLLRDAARTGETP